VAESGDEWAVITWDGNRRAQLRRALARSVRERLEALEHLSEASRRLASLGPATGPRPTPEDRAAGPAGGADPED
jgi:hypothetical protein